MNEVIEIPIKSIKVVENHRTNINATALHELMTSIKQHGLKQAIGVMPKGKTEYVLLFGHRRLEACRKLGHDKILATVEKDVDDENFLIINLTENMQRKDPSFIELGRTINKLESAPFNLTIAEIAARLGQSLSKINEIARVYKGLPAKYRERVVFLRKGEGRNLKKGIIPAEVANKIVRLKKDHGLNDKSIDGVVKHVVENGADRMDLDNVGIMMHQGMNLKEAISGASQYAVYNFDFVAKKADIEKMMSDNGIVTKNQFFKKVIYGELPPIPKPGFIKEQTANRVKKTVEEVKIERFEAMRRQLSVKDRLRELSEEQSMALKQTSLIPASKWNEAQRMQIENMYNDVCVGKEAPKGKK